MGLQITLLLKLEDLMNRSLTAEIGPKDNAQILANELVAHGFIREVKLL